MSEEVDAGVVDEPDMVLVPEYTEGISRSTRQGAGVSAHPIVRHMKSVCLAMLESCWSDREKDTDLRVWSKANLLEDKGCYMSH